VVVIYMEALFLILPGESEGNHEKSLSKYSITEPTLPTATIIWVQSFRGTGQIKNR
jgi:hypothetical protein